MAAVAATPLVFAGPPGWTVLAVLGAATVVVGAAAVMQASKDADESFSDKEADAAENCPEEATPVTEPREYPENPDELLDEGYEETTHPKAAEKGVRRFKNPDTNDEVEFHKGKPGKNGWEGKDHYHRFNPGRRGKGDAMLDKHGNPVPKGSNASHLVPK